MLSENSAVPANLQGEGSIPLANARASVGQVADEIDRAIHDRLRELRDEGLIEVAAFYRVSEAIVNVTCRYR